jgi:CDP-glucose 4,6-dehydratase
MKIAITGATGLLGFHLANYYSDLGNDVYVLLKDEFYKVQLNKNINKIYGNINIKSDVDYFIQKSLPDYFVHLAAQTQAYDSLKYPYNTFYTNIIGTLNVLESLREFDQCSSILIASSDKAYGELETDEYFENHSLGGVYPYDASKSATDLLCRSYRKTYSMPIVTTRACNMYGVGDSNKERLIPGAIRSFAENNIFKIRNSGKDIREYIHVKDVVLAYDKILKFNEMDGSIESFNISSGERYSTIDVFNMIEKCLGSEIKKVIIDGNSFEIKKQFMNSSLLKEKTGWSPSYSLNSSLQEIIDWYLEGLANS